MTHSAEDLILTAAHCCQSMRKGTLVKAGYIQKEEWDNRNKGQNIAQGRHGHYPTISDHFRPFPVIFDSQF